MLALLDPREPKATRHPVYTLLSVVTLESFGNGPFSAWSKRPGVPVACGETRGLRRGAGLAQPDVPAAAQAELPAPTGLQDKALPLAAVATAGSGSTRGFAIRFITSKTVNKHVHGRGRQINKIYWELFVL